MQCNKLFCKTFHVQYNADNQGAHGNGIIILPQNVSRLCDGMEKSL